MPIDVTVGVAEAQILVFHFGDGRVDLRFAEFALDGGADAGFVREPGLAGVGVGGVKNGLPRE